MIPIQWTAGVIDARGHVEIGSRGPRIRVTTARIELLSRLAELTGVKVMIDERGYERRPCGEHCKQRHSHVVRQSAQWTVDSARATVVLYNVGPHLIANRGVITLALTHGLDSWPPTRGNTPAQMAALGWELPQ